MEHVTVTTLQLQSVMSREQLLRLRNALLLQLRVLEEILWPEHERGGRKQSELKKSFAIVPESVVK